jgi:hypothetical protein
MHIETFAINVLFFQLLVALAYANAENALVMHHDLLRIWKMLKAPFLPLKPTKTNHMSNKFWEIDMTKFEP